MPDSIANSVARFRPKANPERYRATAEQHKAELLEQGERILLQYELTAGQPALAPAACATLPLFINRRRALRFMPASAPAV